jgi:uncharacterized protein (DUF433 family)
LAQTLIAIAVLAEPPPLAGGMGFDEVASEYGLTVDDIRAALKFAGKLVEQ